MILEAVVSHPNCPQQILAKLSTHGLWGTKIAVASNPRTSSDTLAYLAKHATSGGQRRYETAEAVALNPSCPPELLEELSLSSRWEVRAGVARNPATPPELIERCGSDLHGEVLVAAATNPRCATDLLYRLAAEEYSAARQHVAANPNCPTQILQHLATDPTPKVHSVAWTHLAHRVKQQDGLCDFSANPWFESD